MSLRLIVTIVLVAGPVASVHAQPAALTDASPHKVEFVHVTEDVRLEVLDWGGSGSPVVLLAGMGNTAHVFDDFAPKLAAHARVLAITRRGYGASTPADSGYDVARLGKDVLAVLDSFKLVEPVLVGHSIAGQELSFIASDFPERIGGVVYIDAAYRYAFYRPGVRENLQELRRKLEQLDEELGKPPRTPAELTAIIRATLGNTLEEFQKDLNELMTTPAIPATAPPPGPSDLKDVASYRAWSTRVHGYALPEAELWQVRTVTPTGGVGPARARPEIAQAIGAGSRRFTDIRVPALAIFASPHGLGPWTRNHPDQLGAFEAFARFDQGMTERQASAFEAGVPGARVVRLPNAGHYIFITNEADVLKEIIAFLERLR